MTYVRQLGAELVASARPTPFDVRFYVIEDDELNAFTVTGGSIYMNTGLIAAAEHVELPVVRVSDSFFLSDTQSHR